MLLSNLCERGNISGHRWSTDLPKQSVLADLIDCASFALSIIMNVAQGYRKSCGVCLWRCRCERGGNCRVSRRSWDTWPCSRCCRATWALGRPLAEGIRMAGMAKEITRISWVFSCRLRNVKGKFNKNSFDILHIRGSTNRIRMSRWIRIFIYLYYIIWCTRISIVHTQCYGRHANRTGVARECYGSATAMQREWHRRCTGVFPVC